MVNASARAVEIAGLSHRYGEQAAALVEVSLDVAPGDAFALIGPNGSGKSTLLSLLATRVKPKLGDGTVLRVAGFDVLRQASAVRQRIAVVFQHPSVDGKLTAEENLKYEAMLHGLRGSLRQARIDEALDAAGLTPRRGDRVEAFSGGMKRRLEIAKAMMHRPAVLLLDEPDTGLDVRALDEVWTQLQSQREAHGTTQVMATHRMELAERCDAVAVLHQGQKVAAGSPDELRRLLPGGSLRVEAEASALPEIAASLEAMRPHWSERARPRIVRHEAVAYDDAPGELAARLQEMFGQRIARVSYGRSTLHDVFLAVTGQELAGAVG